MALLVYKCNVWSFNSSQNPDVANCSIWIGLKTQKRPRAEMFLRLLFSRWLSTAIWGNSKYINEQSADEHGLLQLGLLQLSGFICCCAFTHAWIGVYFGPAVLCCDGWLWLGLILQEGGLKTSSIILFDRNSQVDRVDSLRRAGNGWFPQKEEGINYWELTCLF